MKVVFFALIIWSYLRAAGSKECRVNAPPYSLPPQPLTTSTRITPSTSQATTSTTTSTTTTTTTTTTTKAPTTTKRAPPPPPPPCTRCGALPLVHAIPGINTVNSIGSVAQSVNGAGCKQYRVTCLPFPAKWTAMGANHQYIKLAQTFSAPAYASLWCNGHGQIEGRVSGTNAAIIVSSVYCATSII